MDDNDNTNDSGFRRDEPGMNTGDARENNPGSPGFTEHDRLFRSQFQHANRPRTDDEHVRFDGSIADGPRADGPANPGDFEKVETDLGNGWLNVRVGGGEWASTPDAPQHPRDPALQGRIEGLPPAGTTPSHDRVSFTDPLPDNTDPTEPEGPENRF
jgi:hypothetical protein